MAGEVVVGLRESGRSQQRAGLDPGWDWRGDSRVMHWFVGDDTLCETPTSSAGDRKVWRYHRELCSKCRLIIRRAHLVGAAKP